MRRQRRSHKPEAAEIILDLFVKTKNNQELVRTVVKNHYI